MASNLAELLTNSDDNLNEIRRLYEQKNPKWLRNKIHEQKLFAHPYDATQTMQRLFPDWVQDTWTELSLDNK